MDKWGYNYLIKKKSLWEKDKLLIMSNFPSPTMFSQTVVDAAK